MSSRYLLLATQSYTVNASILTALRQSKAGGGNGRRDASGVGERCAYRSANEMAQRLVRIRFKRRSLGTSTTTIMLAIIIAAICVATQATKCRRDKMLTGGCETT